MKMNFDKFAEEMTHSLETIMKYVEDPDNATEKESCDGTEIEGSCFGKAYFILMSFYLILFNYIALI